MRTRLLATSTTLLLLAGCQLTLVSFTVPAAVPTGQVFEVVVTFSADIQNGTGGCVLQLPVGFTIVAANPPSSGMVRDDPALLGLYAGEPGHYLASWSLGQQHLLGAATYRAFVRAPATPTAGTIKIALAGQPTSQPWQPNSPAGVTSFAQITAATHAQPIAVVDVPPVAFAPDAIGLPYATLLSSLWGVALHDLDGDGDDDLVSNHRTWLRGSSSWTEASAGLVPFFLTEMRVAAGDFDGDGNGDLVHGRGPVYFGDGAGGWTAGPALPLPGPALGVAVGDVNGDGRDDIACGGYFQNYLRVFFGNANRTFTPASNGLPNLPNLGGFEVLLRDVTGDGFLDVVWHDVWAGDGQGNWTPSTGLTGNAALGVETGDLDGDGLPELLHANGSAGVRVHRHLGGNAWALAGIYALPGRSIESVAVLDYDRDGRQDVVFGYRDGTSGLELQRNTGNFVFVPVPDSGLPASTWTYVNDLAVGDVNGDTFPDLAVALFGGGTVVFQNWRAGTSAFGTACAGTLPQAPRVQGSGAPALGNASFAVRVDGGQPGTPALAWLGTSRRTWNGLPLLPLDLGLLGANGCTLWTGPEALVVGGFDAAGTFALPLPIPAVPALRRQTLFAQGAAAASGTGTLQLAFTGGLAIRID
jgi:hypothetical protein